MSGRAEVWRLKQRLDATFKRAARVGSDLELQSDFARYLCVLVSGYLERAVTALVLEHSRRKSAPSVQRFVESQTRRLNNVNSQRLKNCLVALTQIGYKTSQHSSLMNGRMPSIASLA